MKCNFNLISSYILLFVFSLFLIPSFSSGAVLEVGEGKTFSTIQACANVAVAGDTCLVSVGNYNERVSVSNSGNSGNPIIFKNNGGAKVRGFTISGKNYITIDGFEITSSGMTVDTSNSIQVSNSNTGVRILNNNIHHTTSGGIGFGDSNFLTISGNQISYTGISTYSGGGAAALQSLYNRPNADVLIEQNTLLYNSDYLIPGGTRFVYRNNIIGPADPANTIHIDGVQNNSPVDFVLIEGNRSVDNANSDNHFLLTSGTANNWIIRHNSSLRSKGMQQWGVSTGDSSRFAHYNNTWYETFTYYPSWNQIYATRSTNNLSRNNIWYRAVRDPGGNPYGSPTSVDKDYDLVYQSGNTGETHVVNSDPLFVNGPSGDFHLQASSPAIDKGGALTVTTNSGSNSTTLSISFASAFQDGWAGVNKDCIAVGSGSNTSCISSINYSTNTITLYSPISWDMGDPVYLFRNSSGEQVLYGSLPDIGAHEYSSGATPPYSTPYSTPYATPHTYPTPATPSPLPPPPPVVPPPTPSPILPPPPPPITPPSTTYTTPIYNTPITQRPITKTPIPTQIQKQRKPNSYPIATTTTFTRTLYRGLKGEDVLKLQNILITKGYLPRGANTSFFGSLTLHSLKKFQCKTLHICEGTPSTTGFGVVGDRVRVELGW